MMPVDFKERNFVYAKPVGWTDEQCSDLPVFKGNTPIDEIGTMQPVIISKWQPSLEDIAHFVNGGAIYLSVTGTGLPPVFLFTENPFMQEAFANG